jgi:hypothetical protein
VVVEVEVVVVEVLVDVVAVSVVVEAENPTVLGTTVVDEVDDALLSLVSIGDV